MQKERFKRMAMLLAGAILFLSSCTKESASTDNGTDPGGGNGNNNGNQQADEGIFFTIETTGETVRAQFVPGAHFIAPSGETYIYAYTGTSNDTRRSHVQLNIIGKGTSTWPWGAKAASFTYTVPNPGALNTVYNQNYVDGNRYPYSAGGVTITEYGKEYGYIVGTFHLTNSGISTGGNVKISGRFKCKRVGDQ